MLRVIRNKKIKKWYTTKRGKRKCYIDHRPKAWQNWRSSVYKRDDGRCVLCGRKQKRMAPHHILPKRDFPKLKYRVQNGATLCWRCHKKTFYKEYDFVLPIVKKIFGETNKWPLIKYHLKHKKETKDDERNKKRNKKKIIFG